MPLGKAAANTIAEHNTTMRINKRTATALSLTFATVSAMAQSGTLSPYSQYGLGVQSDRSTGFNRGMNGLGLALREHNQVNPMNPASYSAIDSTTFIFDLGLSGQITSYKEGSVKRNAQKANFEYGVAAFRVAKGVGVSFGILPYTNVGYNYNETGYISGDRSNPYATKYYGDGGLHEVYVGVGWEILKGLSVGANVSYLGGSSTHYVTTTYNDLYSKMVSKYTGYDVSSYRLEFGVQHRSNLGKKNSLTWGLTAALGHKLGADATCIVVSSNNLTSATDTARYQAGDAFSIPLQLAMGVAWENSNRLKLGFDVQLQRWSRESYPVYTVTGGKTSYTPNSDYYKDRRKYTFGGEYCSDEYSRRFIKRVRFRAGVSYSTPYYKINGKEGPSELSASLGFGIPIINSYNNRSILNISGQWVRSSAKDFITENTFRINIGLTFNERWFMKWKVE